MTHQAHALAGYFQIGGQDEIPNKWEQPAKAMSQVRITLTLSLFTRNPCLP
jgi:hypothetical protein